MVADAAVRAARRSVEVAGRAPLHAHLHAVHVGVLVQRRAEVVVLVLVLVGCGSTGLETIAFINGRPLERVSFLSYSPVENGVMKVKVFDLL